MTTLASANCGTHFGDTKLQWHKKYLLLSHKVFRIKMTNPGLN